MLDRLINREEKLFWRHGCRVMRTKTSHDCLILPQHVGQNETGK